MRAHSIRSRVVALVLLVELASALAIVGFTFFYERHEHFEALDLSLRGYANTLVGAVQEADDSEDNVVLDRHGLQLPAADMYQVTEAGGRLLGESPNWTAPADLPRSQQDPSTIAVHGMEYRFIRAEGMRVVDPGSAAVRHDVVVYYGAPAAIAWEQVLSAVRSFSVASLVLILVSGFATTALVRRSMSPLEELAREAGCISSRSWSFTPPAGAAKTTELATLVTAIEELIGRLRVSFAQQRQFVSDSAHELKTAVTVVKSSLQLLELRERSVEEYREGLEVCLSDCARMEELVYRMLTLARLEESVDQRGLAEPANEALTGQAALTDLRLGTLAATAGLESVARLRGIDLACTASESILARIAAEDWQTLLSNLIHNAIQHSPRDSAISVILVREQDTAVCRVKDQGEGIAPEVLPHVYDRFFRGDASRARTAGEAGLGLAISKAIVDRAGGTIDIASTVGVGTVVRVAVPCVGGESAFTTPDESVLRTV